MIMLYLLCIIIKTRGHNMNINGQISLTINMPSSIPNCVRYRYSENISCNIYEVAPEDREKFKIGAVYEYGILVYDDSDLLVERKVFKLMRMSTPASIIQINSKYRKSGKEIREIIELVRFPQEMNFREIIRRPFNLDVKPGSLNSAEIRVEMEEHTNKVIYHIKNEDRLKYMIGTVKYGNIPIDNYVNTINYKIVQTYIDVDGNFVVEVKKVVKTAEHIHTKCMIILDDSEETGFCQELEQKITNLYP